MKPSLILFALACMILYPAGFSPAGQSELEMLGLALGSPCRLLTTGQLLFEVHFEDKTDGPPTVVSWEAAKTKLLQWLPPLTEAWLIGCLAGLGAN